MPSKRSPGAVLLIAGLLIAMYLPAQSVGDAISGMQQEDARQQALAPQLWELRRIHEPAATAGWSSLDGMHDYFVARFIATPGMGSGRMFSMTLAIDPQQRLLLTQHHRQQAWSIAQLDLIGIAKHDRPVVFTRVAHGTYEESGRMLTTAEQEALAGLQANKDVISSRGEAGAMLVYGAIRAKGGCLRCHRPAREGSLLGAFRYVLQPSRMNVPSPTGCQLLRTPAAETPAPACPARAVPAP